MTYYSLKLRCHNYCPDLQTFTYCIKNKSKSCESQHDSHRLTDESEQNITTNLSRRNPREKG